MLDFPEKKRNAYLPPESANTNAVLFPSKYDRMAIRIMLMGRKNKK